MTVVGYTFGTNTKTDTETQRLELIDCCWIHIGDKYKDRYRIVVTILGYTKDKLRNTGLEMTLVGYTQRTKTKRNTETQ